MSFETNYVPDPSGNVQPEFHGQEGNLHGSGDPNGSVHGYPGYSFYDDDSGDLYINTGNFWNTTWTVFSSSGGSSSGALATTGSPEGVLTANIRQFAWDATNNVLYIHEGANGTNTGWRELIA